jgi:sulfide:quinone oxidoreductase
MTSKGKTILVLGGGVGGLVVAHELRKQLALPHRVVLIERSTMHLFSPSLLWLMIGQRNHGAGCSNPHYPG